MMEGLIEPTARVLELVGVAAIVIGMLIALFAALRGFAQRRERLEVYRDLRAGIGRAILLGLELLVAADIIETILIRPTLEGAGALAIIVLIRTFLSFSLETEIEGRLPWRSRARERPPD